MMTHPGKKLLFMGQDLGEFDEWNENRQVEWMLGSEPEHEGLLFQGKLLLGVGRILQDT